MKYSYSVAAGDFSAAGEVSSNMKKLLRQLGIDANIIRRASIACYEAELNLIIHSFGGDMSYEITSEDITIVTEDSGPGIDNIDLAMSEGFSTASDEVRSLGFGAGMGLPNIKRCADVVDIQSILGQGTRLVIKLKVN